MRKREIILLTVTGKDRIGLTNHLTNVLAQYDAKILDIAQADNHSALSLAILFEVEKNSQTAMVLKDLLMKAYKLKMHVEFKPISTKQLKDFTENANQERYIVTLLGNGHISARQLREASRIVSESRLNIRTINRLTSSESPNMCVELNVVGKIRDREMFAKSLMEVSKEEGFDIAYQEDNIFAHSRRLVCFDMDSTLIQCEVIDELAKLAGQGKKVSEITEEAMKGKIAFKESFIKRVKLLKGLDVSAMEKVAKNLPLTEGAEKLFKTLKHYGYKIAIISGGFEYFGNKLKEKLGVDYVFANELEVKEGKLTGKHLGEIVDGKRKAEILKSIAKKEGIKTEQVIAVGDGANDIPMLQAAGMGIAFHAKDKVKQGAKYSLSSMGLDGILYLLGYQDENQIH